VPGSIIAAIIVSHRTTKNANEPAVRAEQVDGEVLFERGTITEVFVSPQPGAVDKEIERSDALDSALDLRRVGHIQGMGRNAPIRVGQRLARTGIHRLRVSPQRFLDQRLPDTAIGPVTRTDLFAIAIVTCGLLSRL